VKIIGALLASDAFAARHKAFKEALICKIKDGVLSDMVRGYLVAELVWVTCGKGSKSAKLEHMSLVSSAGVFV
jgi:hypothetical protein